MASIEHDQYYSSQDVEAAVSELSDQDIAKLLLYAKLYLVFGARRLIENDLVSEAIERTLNGKRHWNRENTFVKHLQLTMKSIATDDARKADRLFEIQVDPHDHENDESVIEKYGDEAIDDRAREAASAVELIFERFQEDAEALLVLNELLSGDTRANTLTNPDMDEKKHAAARKRIMRAVVKLRTEGQL